MEQSPFNEWRCPGYLSIAPSSKSVSYVMGSVPRVINNLVTNNFFQDHKILPYISDVYENF